jgi:hypothetical protein
MKRLELVSTGRVSLNLKVNIRKILWIVILAVLATTWLSLSLDAGGRVLKTYKGKFAEAECASDDPPHSPVTTKLKNPP